MEEVEDSQLEIREAEKKFRYGKRAGIESDRYRVETLEVNVCLTCAKRSNKFKEFV